MPINDKFFYINIRDYLALGNDNEAGEPMLNRVLSGFSCPKNPDVERFLKKSAVELGIDGVEFHAVHEGYLLALDSQIKCKLRRARKSGSYFIRPAFIESTYIFMEITD